MPTLREQVLLRQSSPASAGASRQTADTRAGMRNMRAFDFHTPRTGREASEMLSHWGADDCRIIAGGTALMLVLRQRMVTPSHVISVAKIPEMRGIRFDAVKGLCIGALERHSDIAESELVRQHCPMLASMASQVANPQVRNQGTIGGNLCYGDPTTDPPSCLMAVDARLVLQGLRGRRILRIEDFLLGYFATDIQEDEVLVEVQVPPLAQDVVCTYVRFKKTAADHRPLVNVAVLLRAQDLVCTEVRLVVGASVPVARRVAPAEEFLQGRVLDVFTADAAAQIVAENISAISDARGSEAYRRDMVRVVTRRAIESLISGRHQEDS
jgi:carbon-monoxide dehydrogenase medium subunit